MGVLSDDGDDIIVIKLMPDTTIEHARSAIGRASDEGQVVVFQVASDTKHSDEFFGSIVKEAIEQDVKVAIERESPSGLGSD